MRHRLRTVAFTSLLLAAAPSVQRAAPPAAPQTPALQVGQTVGGHIKSNERHQYRVVVPTGTFVQILVDGQVEPLVLTLSAPDGSTVAEVVAEDGRQPTSVCFVSERPGEYVLNLRLAVPVERTYRLTLVEKSEATEAHAKRVAAERLLEQAKRASDGDEGVLRAALEPLQQALALYRETADGLGQIHALRTTGRVYFYLGNLDGALECLRGSRHLYRSSGDRLREADTVEEMSSYARTLGDYQAALDLAREGVDLYRSAGDSGGLVNGLMGLGNTYVTLNDPEHAADAFEQADALQNNPMRLPNCLMLAAEQHNLAGQKAQAIANYEAAMVLSRNAKRAGEEAGLQIRVAAIYAETGNREQAAKYFGSALAFFESQPGALGYRTLSQLGQAFATAGDARKAVEYLDRALAVAPASNPLRGRDLGALGVGYTQVGEREKALACDRDTLKFARSEHNVRRESRILARMAANERDLGRLDEARAHLEEAQRLFEQQRNSLAGPSARAAYFATVQQHYELYVDILMRLHAARPQAHLAAAALEAAERGRGRSLLDLLTEASVDIRQGLDAALVGKERSLERQMDALAVRRQALVGVKNTGQQDAVLASRIAGLTVDYEFVQGQLRKASPRYATLRWPAPLTVEDIQRQVLDADTLLLEYLLGDTQSYLWVVSQDHCTGFFLPARTEIEDVAKRVYEALTARHRYRPGETAQQRNRRLAAARTAYGTAAAKLSELVLAPAAPLLADKRLLIVGHDALQYIPFAALPTPSSRQSQDARPPLGAEHEIVYAPSASVLASMRLEARKRERPTKAVAVLADPVFDRDDPRVSGVGAGNASFTRRDAAGSASGVTGPRGSSSEASTGPADVSRSLTDVGVASGRLRRLVFSRREADTITAALADDQKLEAVSFQASKQTALSSHLARYRIVHFATHGLLDSENPALSGIVLSLVDERGKPQDGFLRLHDIYNLSLPVDLVVLSACQTALGKEVRGEGLVGLTRGFMYAGASSVAASLWSVDDVATSELMARFYRSMLHDGRHPAAALREAMRQMRRETRWRDPYFWAAFQIQGDWK